jgi:hypothetical protein
MKSEKNWIKNKKMKDELYIGECCKKGSRDKDGDRQRKIENRENLRKFLNHIVDVPAVPDKNEK